MILAIDPGLTATGIAIYDPRIQAQRLRSGDPLPVAALRSLRISHTIQVARREELTVRLATLAGEVAELAAGVHPRWQSGQADLVVIEMPAYSGDYAARGRTRNNAKAINLLHLAIGSMIGVLSDYRIRLVTADRQPKERRHAVLSDLAARLGIELPEGPRGGRRMDEMDAMWLGWQAVMDLARPES